MMRYKALLFKAYSSLQLMFSLASSQCGVIVFSWVSLGFCPRTDRHFLCRWGPFLPFLLVPVSESSRGLQRKEDLILRIQWLWPKDSRENIVGRGLVLCLCYEITNGECNMRTREQICVPIFLHTLSKTSICGHLQQSTGSFERVARSQDSQTTQRIMQHHE